MGQVSASSIDEQTKLTMTNLQGLQDPHACEQSGKLDPAIPLLNSELISGFVTVFFLLTELMTWRLLGYSDNYIQRNSTS